MSESVCYCVECLEKIDKVKYYIREDRVDKPICDKCWLKGDKDGS